MCGSRSWILLIAVLVMDSGCAATLPPCPERGGPAWREYSTAHFDLRSDLDPEDAQKVVRALEDARAAMLAVFWKGGGEPPGRSLVVALASVSTREVFLGRALAGRYVRAPPFSPSMLFAGSDHAATSVLRHELGHDIGRWFLPLQPDWVSEGIACLLETVQYDRDRKRAVGGDVSPRWLQAVRGLGLMDVERLLTMEVPTDALDLARFEASSWLLVHYLVNHRKEAFLRFQERLGLLQPSRDAWLAEFPDLDPATLTEALTRYAQSGSFGVAEPPLELAEWEVSSRPLSDPEVHAIRGYLFALFGPLGEEPDLKAAGAEIAEALRAERAPIDALAVAFYRLQGRTNSESRIALARRAVESHPESWLAWLMAADAKDFKDAAYGSALVRALARAPENREVLERMAAFRASERRWGDAMAFSRKAIKSNSRTPELLLLHVRALAETGQCAEAARWLNAMWPVVPSAQRSEIAETRKDLDRVCATKAPAPAAMVH